MPDTIEDFAARDFFVSGGATVYDAYLEAIQKRADRRQENDTP